MNRTSAQPVPLEQPAIPRASSRGGLPLSQTFVIAWRAILGNPLRSILTALGVIIGVGAVIALTSLGSGATSGIQAQLAGLGTNLLTVSSGQARQGGPPGIVRSGGAQTITVGDVKAIAALEGVAGVAPTVQRNLQVKAGSDNTSSTVIGTYPAYETVRNSAVEIGAWFTESDLTGRKRVAVAAGEFLHGLLRLRPANRAEPDTLDRAVRSLWPGDSLHFFTCATTTRAARARPPASPK